MQKLLYESTSELESDSLFILVPNNISLRNMLCWAELVHSKHFHNWKQYGRSHVEIEHFSASVKMKSANQSLEASPYVMQEWALFIAGVSLVKYVN